MFETRFSPEEQELGAAEYYKAIRLSPEEWRILYDVEPQMKEFSHRIRGKDYENAAEVLTYGDLDVRFLLRHGYVLHALDMHRKLEAHKDKLSPASRWANQYGLAYANHMLGRLGTAIRYAEQAKTFAMELAPPQRFLTFNMLANLYYYLAKFEESIENQMHARDIAQAAKRRPALGTAAGNLSKFYAALGNLDKAMKWAKESLTIFQQLQEDENEDFARSASSHIPLAWMYLARIYIDQGKFDQAIDTAKRAAEGAESAGLKEPLIEIQYYGALAHFYAGNLESAFTLVEKAHAASPSTRTQIYVTPLLGIVELRRSNPEAAGRAFAEALAHADRLLMDEPKDIEALDTKWLAVCGLSLSATPKAEDIYLKTRQSAGEAEPRIKDPLTLRLLEALEQDNRDAVLKIALTIYNMARDISSARGVVARAKRLFDALERSTSSDQLEAVSKRLNSPIP